MTRVAVVGGGLAGLSAASYLRGAGFDVHVFEAAAQVGGRISSATINGHIFDVGATVLTMPGLIVDAMVAAGTGRDDAWAQLDLLPVDPTYTMRYADGTELRIDRDLDALTETIGSTFGARQAAGFRRLRRWLAELYEVEFDSFAGRNVDHILDYLRGDSGRNMTRLVTMGAMLPLSRVVGRFIDDERLLRAFTFQALYAGVPPQRAPGVYAVIAQMDIGMGLYYPRGGMGRIAAVMADAITAGGGRISCSTPIGKVVVSDGRVRGICTRAGGEIDCEAVVLTTDMPVAEALMTDADHRRRRRVRYSPSALVMHGTVDTSVTRSWPGGHHTIDFGRAWTSTFTEITSRNGRLMSDPSLLLTRPAHSDPGHFTARGRESVSVLAPCPNLVSAGLPWDELAEPYARELLGILDSRGYRGIATEFDFSRIDHPLTWSRAGMSAGTPFAAAHTYTQTGVFRTANVWKGVPTVVLAGSATVPGVGIPPVLVSGRLAAERVQQSQTATRQR